MGLLIGLALAFVAGGLLAYWALVLAEGVYLGPRAVTWLYDRVAPRYDRIKNVDPEGDRRYLARPLLLALEGIEGPCVLDVGTGSGRLPAALGAEAEFWGHVVGIDRSAAMLAQARRKLQAPAIALALADAGRRPFAAATFDAVVCLESLEFTPQPKATLGEMVRVLRPHGVLLASNRVGWDALWYPGRHCGRGHVEALLREVWAKRPEM